MAALLADALRFGSLDLRYQGFLPATNRRDEKRRFCVDRLREAREQLVWAIAEGPRLMPELTPDILKYGRDPENAWSSCCPTASGCALQAARIFDERVRWIDQAQLQLENLALELNRERTHRPRTSRRRRRLPAGRVSRAAASVDRNLVADAMRHLTAQVLNLLYDHRCGPAAAQWGDRFDDVRERGTHAGRGSPSRRHGHAGTRPTSSTPAEPAPTRRACTPGTRSQR